MLQHPFFDKDADNAINFGAMEAVVRHKMTHAIVASLAEALIKIETTLNELAKNENIYNTRFRNSN
jgi:predicted metalloendopeptidase